MTDIQRLDMAGAAIGLRAVAQDARGFLGVDPVTQNDALLAGELTRLGAQVFRGADTVLGYLTNPDQPRQVFVASTSADPAPLRALLEFCGTYQRCTSYVALVPAGSTSVAAFQGCGFAQVGTLPAHRYQGGGYADVLVYFATGEDACRS